MGILEGTEALLPARSVLPLEWPELEQALPDHGFPRGVVEIAAMPRLHGMRQVSPAGGSMLHGGATSIAIAVMRAIHAADSQAWCAWISAPLDPPHGSPNDRTPPVHAPALAQANVDLDRLLIVRPSRQALARTVVKVAASGAFDLVIIDAPHRNDLSGLRDVSSRTGRGGAPPQGKDGSSALVVRKLALAAEECGTSSLLLTSALTPRSVPWPVALRLEVERRPDALAVRVTKDRRGAGSSQHVVRLAG